MNGSSLSNRDRQVSSVLEVKPALLHRLFYPQVPAVLSAQYNGKVSAMPVVSYASVSVRPPLVAVGCDPASFTFKLASRAGAFSLCLLDRKRLKAIERLAATSGRTVDDKLQAAGLTHSKGKEVDVPVIEGADAVIECVVHSKRRLGDHFLVVGLVKTASASASFSDFWNFRRYRPILYTGWRDGMSTYPVG